MNITWRGKTIRLNNSRKRQESVNLGDIHLTPRATEILMRKARGKTLKEIADELGISRETVNQHIDIATNNGNFPLQSVINAADEAGLLNPYSIEGIRTYREE
jgi:DNA-binding CsgD family transcriptional regulator